MRIRLLLIIMTTLSAVALAGCRDDHKTTLVDQLGEQEYSRLMGLSLDDFDQSADGFRAHAGDYELICLLIPEYIEVNQLPSAQVKNLHWHLGQIHAFNDNYGAAIPEMMQSYVDGSDTWRYYVDGTIAFLERDKEALRSALNGLGTLENQMNIEVLEKLLKYFDESYSEAYSKPY